MSLATTVDAVLGRVKRSVNLTRRSPVYTLAGAVDADDTSVTVGQQARHQGVGSVLSVGLEMMLVTGVSGAQLTVIRGHEGTEAAAHAAGAIVEVDSRVSKALLFDYLQVEVAAWGDRIWRPRDAALAGSALERLYDLPDAARVIYLLEARQAPETRATGSWRSWPTITAKLLREMSADEFPSGYAVQLDVVPAYAGSIRVAWAEAFDLTGVGLDTDLVGSTGLTVPAIDALEAGMKYRLAVDGLLPRADDRSMGMAQDGEVVSATDVMRTVDMLGAVRQRAIADAGNALRSAWPFGGV
jgi:hypothetical protein